MDFSWIDNDARDAFVTEVVMASVLAALACAPLSTAIAGPETELDGASVATSLVLLLLEMVVLAAEVAMMVLRDQMGVSLMQGGGKRFL